MPCNRWWPVLCVTALVACSATPTKESAAPVSQPTAPAETTTAVVASEAEQAFRSAITKPLAAQKKGRCEKALRAWQNLQREYPSQALIPFNMALCHRQLGDSQAAGDALQQALALQPDSAVIMVEYALWLRGQGQLTAAEAMYLQALTVAPEHLPAHYNLAILYDLYLAKPAIAAAHYQRFLQFAPDKTTARYQTVQRWLADVQTRLPETVIEPQGEAHGR